MRYKSKGGNTLSENLGLSEERANQIISVCNSAEEYARNPSTPNMTQADVMVRIMNELQPESIMEAVFIGYCNAKVDEVYKQLVMSFKLFS